jgi:hypothetical protein
VTLVVNNHPARIRLPPGARPGAFSTAADSARPLPMWRVG